MAEIKEARKNLTDAMESTIKCILSLQSQDAIIFTETIKELKQQVGDMAVAIQQLKSAGL